MLGRTWRASQFDPPTALSEGKHPRRKCQSKLGHGIEICDLVYLIIFLVLYLTLTKHAGNILRLISGTGSMKIWVLGMLQNVTQCYVYPPLPPGLASPASATELGGRVPFPASFCNRWNTMEHNGTFTPPTPSAWESRFASRCIGRRTARLNDVIVCT